MIEALLKTEPKRKRRKTVSDRLKNDLIKAIEAGNLVPGDIIPSENLLAEEYKMSRSSVRSALDELQNSGLIEKRPGKGSFVCDQRESTQNNSILTIGLDIEPKPDSNDWYGAHILHGVENACKDDCCRIAIFRKNNLNGLKKGFYDGIILSSLMIDDMSFVEVLPELGIQPVIMNRIIENPQIAYVSVDYRYESMQAVKYLLESGYRKIGIISAQIHGHMVNELRHKGFADAEKETGVNCVQEQCIVKSYQDNSYYIKAIYNFLKKTSLDAIYLLNGSLALPLLTAMKKLNIKSESCPSIICFDDIGYLHSIYEYPFSYVKMPLQTMGYDATNYLINRLRNGNDIPVLKKVYRAEIITAK